jgi:amino acid transporter
MSTTWIRFNAAMKAQGLDRKTFLPYRSRLQPFAAWYAFVMSFIILILSGYTLFYPGAFAADLFIFQCKRYFGQVEKHFLTDNLHMHVIDGMVFIVLAIIIGWKVIKRTRFLRGSEVDLHSDLQELDDYTEDVSGHSFGLLPCSMY